jgi:tetratricopeptide (TPR) repeat protein
MDLYLAKEHEKAIEFGKNLLKRESIVKNPIVKALVFHILGANYRETGKLSLSLKYFKKAIRIVLKYPHESFLMKLYYEIGLTYYKKGFLAKALSYFKKSLELSKKIGNQKNKKEVQAPLINNIATIYLERMEFDEALKYYQKALKLATDEENKATIYGNLAVLYNYKKNYQKAIECSLKAIKISEDNKNFLRAFIEKLNLGEIYRNIKDFKKAKTYLLEGLEGVKEMGDKYWEAVGYKYLGSLCMDEGNKELAKKYLLQAHEMAKSMGEKRLEFEVLVDLEEIMDKSKNEVKDENFFYH